MARIVIELTNRCNLSCQHCFEERHAATGDLPLEIFEKVLREAKGCGFDHLCFTGGEATIHRQFSEIVRRLCEDEYTFSFVSNGLNFHQIYPMVLGARQWLTGVTFSLDGAAETTHDRQRGKGSYRRVMQAASVCVVRDIPFTFNTVLTAQNRGEVCEIVELGAKLGARGVRFGHLMSTPETALRGLDLSPKERLEVEAEIWRLKETAPILVAMAPGHFSDAPFFPCGPLERQELNLDYRGNVTFCCQLSGHSGAGNHADIIGTLSEISFADAVVRFERMVEVYLAAKKATIARGDFGQLDHFPCWYCLKYHDKTSWLKNFPNHPWAHKEDPKAGRIYDNA